MRKKRINSKAADNYLNIIMPLVMIYTSFTCLWIYFGSSDRDRGVMEVLIIFCCSFLMVYGFKSLLRDLKLFGFCWTLRNFFGKEIKSK